MRHALSVFFLALQMGFKQSIRNWIVLLGSFLTFAAIMVFYAGVIRMIPLVDLSSMHLTHTQMIWYIATTELMLFCTPSYSYQELQMDIKNGQIHLAALRPISSAFIRVSFWVGDSLARFLVFLVPYLVFITLLSGHLVFSPLHFLGLVASFPIAMLIALCGWYFIGGACLWIGQSEPLYWVWQKLIFVLGALLWPVLFYPEWLQKMVWVFPFRAYLAVGGNWTLDMGYRTYALGFLHQMAWLVVFVVLLRWYDRKILRHIQETGA